MSPAPCDSLERVEKVAAEERDAVSAEDTLTALLPVDEDGAFLLLVLA